MKNYDLNVWDWVGYNTGYFGEGWKIDIYECDENFRHNSMPERIIYLNETQAKMLTLGVSEECGGDYCADTDFWIGPAAFLKIYKDIPRKVRRYLEELV